jgi:uncharacterized protein (TIRG00374 family)
MRKKIIRYGLIFGLTGVLLFFFFRSIEWSKLFSSITHINIFFFILIIVLAPFHLITRAWRWKYLILPEKKDVKLYNLVAGQAVGFTVTLILPGRLGEIVKPLFLAKKENLNAGFALGTVVVERLFDIIAMVFLLAVFLLAQPLYQSAFPLNPSDERWLFSFGLLGLGFDLIVFLIVLGLHFFKSRTLKMLAFLFRPLPKNVGHKIHRLIEEFIQGLRFFRSVKDLLRFFALSLVVWLAIIGYYWLFFLAFREPQAYYKVIPYVFLTMVGASIPTPGMVGGFDYFSKEGLMRLYFNRRIPAGAGPEMARALSTKAAGMTLVIHALQVVMTCLVGFVILWREGISLLQLKKMGEEFQE